MQKVYPELRKLGAEVVAVSFAPPRLVKNYVEKYPLPFPVVSDPERAAYRALALDRTTWREILRPRVLGRYLRFLFQGWMPQMGNREEDVLQLGGDFVLDAARKLVYAYRSAEPTDRPSAAELLEAVRRIAGAESRE